MATQYTSILKLALPVQGELSGTWGDVVNDNITSMVEEAIAGRKVINTWTTNSHTLTTADGTTSESRAAILTLTDTGTALTGAGTVICPAASKIYIVENGTGQTITVKTSSGTGVAVPNTKNMVVFCDGTNVEEGITNINSLTLNGDGATVSSIKDEDNMASDSATALATQQSIKAYVDSQVGANNELSEVLANGNTTGGTDISVSSGDDITFADSSKAIFGAGSDLQIYHDGSNSFIDDTGTGSLIIRAADNLEFQKYTGETYITAAADGAVDIYYNDARKLATTSTGIDVTGTVTADGAEIDVTRSNTAGSGFLTLDLIGTGGDFAHRVDTSNAYYLDYYTGTTWRPTIKIEGQTGDISFYEDTGTTAKFFWDASAERLGIGTSSPANTLHVEKSVSGDWLARLRNTHTTNGYGVLVYAGDDSSVQSFKVANHAGTGDYLVVRGDGNVGIGTSSPQNLLHVNKSDSLASAVQFTNSTTGATSTDGIFLGLGSGEQGYFWNYEANDLILGTSNEERMRIDSSGSVGIGTSSPEAGLHVEGASGFGAIQIGRDTGAAQYQYINLGGNQAGDEAWQFGRSPNTGGVGGAGNLYFYDLDNSATRMVITTAGNVGIGTSAPGDTLQLSGGNIVNPNSSGSEITSATFGVGVNIHFEERQPNGAFSDRTDLAIVTNSGFGLGESEKFRLTAGGNVGIGTSSPSDLLTIQSPASGGGNGLTIQRNDNGTDQRVGAISFGNTVDTDLAQITVQTSSGNNGDGNLLFHTQTNGGSSTERMRIDSTGNLRVGIGNTFEPVMQYTNSGRVAGNPGFTFNDDLDTGMYNPGAQGSIAFTNNGTQTALLTATEVVFNDLSNDQDFRVESNNNANMIFVDAGSNEVGIGTGDPGATFDVAGTSRARDMLITQSSGYATLEMSGPSGSFIDLKAGEVDYNGRIITFGSGMTIDTASGEDLQIQAGGEGRIQIVSGGETVVNEPGNDRDFRVESDGNANMLFVDAGLDNVGIGTGSPTAPLEINASTVGTFSYTGFKLKYGTSSVQSLTMGQVTAGNGGWFGTAQYRSAGNWRTEGTAAGVMSFSGAGGITFSVNDGLTANTDYLLTDRFHINPADAVFNEPGNDYDFRVESNNNSNMLFVDAGNDTVKIGTTENAVTAGSANARLVVANGIEVTQDLAADSLNKDMLRLSNSGSWSTPGNSGFYSDITWDNGGTNTMGRIGLRFGGTATGGNSEITIRDMYQGGFGLSGNIVSFGSNRFSIFDGSMTVNEDSLDQDFRVESDSNANAIFMDAGTSTTGFGTGSPDSGYRVDVSGGVKAEFIRTASTSSGYTSGQTISLTAGSVTEARVYQVFATRHTGTANKELEMGYVYYSGNGAGAYAQVVNAGNITISVSGSTISASNDSGTATLYLTMLRIN